MRQAYDALTKTASIDAIQLQVGEMARYASYARYRWGTNLAEHPEFFMAQDVERWENGQYVQTMYCMTNSGHPEINKGYVLESVHIDKPHERAYHHFPELPE